MKKVLFFLLLTGFISNVFAQEAEDKKFQAGLILGSGLAFQKMGTKYLKNDGGNDLTVGANFNFNFSETIGLCTGLEFDFATMKYKQGESPVYYFYKDSEILQAKDVDLTNAATTLYNMTERKQKAIYMTIPTMLTFRTSFFGAFRYFGKFGLRNSFLLSNKVNDEGYDITQQDSLLVVTARSNENMKIKNETVFFKSAVGLCGGAEWNFSGSTSLVAEIGYYYGITQLYWKRNGDADPSELKTSLYTFDGSNAISFGNRATQSQLMLKVSILF